MNNYRNNRKNRFKSNNDRGFRKRSINGHKNHGDFNSGSEFRHRNPGRNNQNASKLVEKYNNLAREALSTGDKILSENYFQHADHFTRILNEKGIQRKMSFKNKDLEETTDTNENRENKENSISNEKDGAEDKHSEIN